MTIAGNMKIKLWLYFVLPAIVMLLAITLYNSQWGTKIYGMYLVPLCLSQFLALMTAVLIYLALHQCDAKYYRLMMKTCNKWYYDMYAGIVTFTFFGFWFSHSVLAFAIRKHPSLNVSMAFFDWLIMIIICAGILGMYVAFFMYSHREHKEEATRLYGWKSHNEK